MARLRESISGGHGGASEGDPSGFTISLSHWEGRPADCSLRDGTCVALFLLRANQILAARNFTRGGTWMIRHCGEFPNPWPSDIYVAVCVCLCVCVRVYVCVLLGEAGSIDLVNFFKFSKGSIHIFFHNYSFSFNWSIIFYNKMNKS